MGQAWSKDDLGSPEAPALCGVMFPLPLHSPSSAVPPPLPRSQGLPLSAPQDPAGRGSLWEGPAASGWLAVSLSACIVSLQKGIDALGSSSAGGNKLPP